MKSGRILKNSFLINKKKWKFNKNNEKKISILQWYVKYQ